MPKEFLKKIIPSPARIKKIRALHVLGDWVYDGNLWHITRYSASMAFFVGLFVAFMPIPGQTLVAAVLAVYLRCNLPLAVSLVFITNPVTMPPIFFMAYEIGALIVDVPVRDIAFEPTFHWLGHSLAAIWEPFLLGCLICGLFFGAVGYVTVSQLWRWRVSRLWLARKQQRARRKPNDPD
ncbi:MAG: DUF2062 domain-containing protein [Halioglobus sp.]